MGDRRHLTAAEAADLLGVTLPTLYAYVSRGLLRSQPAGGSRRSRLYLAEDVQRLLQRRAYRRDPSRAVADSLHWGAPILETELTNITAAGPFYRGRNAVELARTGSFEAVAALLWTGEMADAADLFSPQNLPPSDALSGADRGLPALTRVKIALARASAHDLRAYDRDLAGENTLRTGARILRLMASVLAGRQEPETSIARTLQESWCPGQEGAERLLDAALILSADHELSVSSFTARVVASSEANLYLVVIAALAALQGFKHGGAAELADAFLAEVAAPEKAHEVVAARLRRGDPLPGFGHPLYPSGDPRAGALFSLLDETHGAAVERRLAAAVIQAVGEATGRQPNIDFALATPARTLHLPAGSALALFALGRAAGWIGHALEQYRSGEMIRPRATYVGPPAAL